MLEFTFRAEFNVDMFDRVPMRDFQRIMRNKLLDNLDDLMEDVVPRINRWKRDYASVREGIHVEHIDEYTTTRSVEL